jgi:ASC-1-like (ASCH) protein
MQKLREPIECSNPWFTYIKNGEKTVEGRKQSSIFKSIYVGEILKFILKDSNEYFYTKVVDIKYYTTLEDYLMSTGVKNCLPGVQLLEEGIKIYSLIFYFQKQLNFKLDLH